MTSVKKRAYATEHPLDASSNSAAPGRVDVAPEDVITEIALTTPPTSSPLPVADEAAVVAEQKSERKAQVPDLEKGIQPESLKESTVAERPDSGVPNAAPHLSDQTNLLPKKQLMILFPGLAVTLFAAYLDQTIVTTALPKISSNFNGGNVAWVGTSYLMTSTAAQPLYGRLSDIFGWKHLLLFAIGTFVLGSILCATAKSMLQLIVFRGVAGVGGGGIISMVMIIMSDVVTLRERGKYQGYLGISMALSGAVGPLVGGLFSELVSWRWCFWINVPIEVSAIVSILWLLPLKKVEGSTREKLLKVDYLGVAIVVASTVLILLSVNWGGITFAWDSVQVLCTLIPGLALVGVFILVEGKLVPLPIVPLHIFRNRVVVGVYLCTFATGIVYMVQLYYLPQFYQVIRGSTAIISGLQLIPVLVSQTVGSYAGAWVVTKTGRCRPIILFGFAAWTLGIGLVSSLNEHTPEGAMVIYLILCGVGAGSTFQTTLVSLQSAVDRKDMAVVTALRNFFRAVGGITGLSIASAVLNNTLIVELMRHAIPRNIVNAIISDPLSVRNGNSVRAALAAEQVRAVYSGYTQGLSNVFRFCIPAAGLSLVTSYFLIAHQELTRKDDEEQKAQSKNWVDARNAKRAVKQKAEGVLEKPDETH